ncbi:hypothetical protein BHM03_00051117 [Ensete ventricosum]|nr:hypothetical protein BHM03_00051117 [Ensete ventricosum]
MIDLLNSNRSGGVYCKKVVPMAETTSFMWLSSSRRALVARGGEMSASSKGSDWSFSPRWVQIDGVRRAATVAQPTLSGKVDSRGCRSSTLEIKIGREPMAVGLMGEELTWSGNMIKIASDHCRGEKDWLANRSRATVVLLL